MGTDVAALRRPWYSCTGAFEGSFHKQGRDLYDKLRIHSRGMEAVIEALNVSATELADSYSPTIERIEEHATTAVEGLTASSPR